MEDAVSEFLASRSKGRQKEGADGFAASALSTESSSDNESTLSKDLVLYCGRHNFGTRVYAKTGNLKAVMTVMGHKDVKTAMRYQQPDQEIVRSALNGTARAESAK